MYNIIIGGIIIVIVLIVYQKKRVAICKSTKKLQGKTVIVTGGTAGIGFEIAKDFARRGAKVIIACPFDKEGNTALERITKITGNREIYFKKLDLASLKSVRNFATQILEQEKRLDILVNNAGVGIPGNFLTDDGINFIMQVNYYGHFLLTLLLLPLLKSTDTQSEPARIISMTSVMRKYASLEVDNYNKIGVWSKVRVYANSKLSLVMFSRELAKRLQDSNVLINSADPGVVATGIYYSVNRYIAPFINLFIYSFLRTAWQGAQTVIHMATDNKTDHISGREFENCKLTDTNMRGDFDLASKKLWDQSVRLVQLEEYELNRALK
ncbi:retinol dehydrogenase 11-like [Pararge aegeria]|uniref:retinol dehydrogenase 11-like n=1 Tax=Pararge aegeria TaxID=116150 RepID=UPI0019D0EE21|nr:retinol dehydrogenase 11-like [Pararge aegeria]